MNIRGIQSGMWEGKMSEIQFQLKHYEYHNPDITAHLSTARHIQCDERWLITRVETKIEGFKWVPALAPSKRLFKKYLSEWKGTLVEDYCPPYVQMFQPF